MDSIRKLEVTVAGWYKTAPHLPESGQKWLAENAWWLTLVGVILGIVGVLGILSATLFAGALLVGFGGAAGVVIGGIALVTVLVSLALMLADVIIAGIAISPLKAMRKRGWTLLFIVLLINVASLVITSLFSYNLFGLVWGLLFVAVGAYFLFETRSFFEAPREAKKVHTRKV